MIATAFNRVSAAVRSFARATMDQINAVIGSAGLDAGKRNRLTRGRGISGINENALPQEHVQRARWSAWDMYRNNPHARKIVRTLEAKVIGRGLHPHSQAIKADGNPHVDFRERAQQLWEAIAHNIDYRGRPGQGGQSMVQLQRQALRAVVLGGDALYRLRPVTKAQMRRQGLLVPLQLQLIHAERLDENLTQADSPVDRRNRIYRGIEVDEDGVPVRYWLLDQHPSDPLFAASNESKPVPASEMGHLYYADDVDQLRGTTWFAPSNMQMRDTYDYQYNELKSSAVAACVALAFSLGTGQKRLGVSANDGTTDLTDAAGNRITAMQPGMIINKGQDGSVELLNPTRNGTNAEAFINHMLRSVAAGFPGVKSSTITGDYRNSSFSSERSADNDAWPELEGVQDWFTCGFTQPIYEELITAAVTYTDWFKGIVTAEEFAARKRDFLAATWQGPVARSINPTDDAKGAALRIKAGISTPQIEAAKLGLSWRDLLKDVKEFTDFCTFLGIDENLTQQYLGIEQQDQPEQPAGNDPAARSWMGDEGEDLSRGEQTSDAAA